MTLKHDLKVERAEKSAPLKWENDRGPSFACRQPDRNQIKFAIPWAKEERGTSLIGGERGGISAIMIIFPTGSKIE